jgi:uncharacterized protein YkwD
MRISRRLLTSLILVTTLTSQAGAATLSGGEAPSRPGTTAPAAQRFEASVFTAAGYDGTAEGSFLNLLNAHRAALGVGPLRTDAGLTDYARTHAQNQATVNQLHHSNISVLLGPFSLVGENVGIGPDVVAIHQAFVASPEHHRNIADPAFTHAGVGVFVDGGGRIWTTHIFGKV